MLLGLAAEQDTGQLGTAVEQLVQRGAQLRPGDPDRAVRTAGLARPRRRGGQVRLGGEQCCLAQQLTQERRGRTVGSLDDLVEVNAVKREGSLVEAKQRVPRGATIFENGGTSWVMTVCAAM